MGFLPNNDNSGPERDRKTGIFRLWEMLSRDFWDLFRAGFLALLGCAPFLLGTVYSLSAHVLIYAPAAGLLGGALLSTQVFFLFHAGSLGLNLAAGAGLAAGILLVLALSLYLWPQLALMELPFLQLVKNSALLFLGQLPRSVAALAIAAGYLGLSAQFYLFALPLLPFTSLWLPVLPALFLIYPGINESFHIEDQLRGT